MGGRGALSYGWARGSFIWMGAGPFHMGGRGLFHMGGREALSYGWARGYFIWVRAKLFHIGWALGPFILAGAGPFHISLLFHVNLARVSCYFIRRSFFVLIFFSSSLKLFQYHYIFFLASRFNQHCSFTQCYKQCPRCQAALLCVYIRLNESLLLNIH